MTRSLSKELLLRIPLVSSSRQPVFGADRPIDVVPVLCAALRSQAALRAWASGSQGSQGGMCSDSESAGGSSESRSMDSPTASPGRRIPHQPVV